MPKATWGIEREDIDDFDRDSQYTPYAGPIPPNAVYQWKIKVLKFIAGDRQKLPQLRVGLALVPRAGYDEKQYKDYFLMAFIPVSNKTQFRYVPFLDAIGVTSAQFTERTITDEEGNIKRIGTWRNDRATDILAEVKNGVDQDDNPRKEIGWMGAADATEPDEEEEYEEEEADDDYEEEPAPPRRTARKTTAAKPARTANRRSRVTEDDDF